MRYPDFPEPMGVFRDVEQERYVDLVRKQIDQAKATKGEGDLQKLIDGQRDVDGGVERYGTEAALFRLSGILLENSYMCWSKTFCACGSLSGRRSSLITFVPMPIHSRQQSAQTFS